MRCIESHPAEAQRRRTPRAVAGLLTLVAPGVVFLQVVVGGEQIVNREVKWERDGYVGSEGRCCGTTSTRSFMSQRGV